jgi:hypothetical protein
MTRPPWTIVIGSLSGLAVLYFWVTMVIPIGWLKQRAGDLFPLLLAILISAVLSAVAGTKGSRWWYLATFANASTLVWVMLRFH